MNLSELIDTHRGGRSYVELARDCGGAPTDKRLQQLVRKPIRNFPDPPTVMGLARGLRVSQSAVVLAAAESLGLNVGSSMPRLVELLPAGTQDLTEQQAAAIAHLVRTIVDRDEGAGDDGSDVPMGGGPEPTVAGVFEARRRHALQEGDDREPGIAAREDATGQRSRGQRARDALNTIGEESQDDGAD